MNYNLIPKSLARQKLNIFRNINFYDLALALCYFGVALAIGYSLTWTSITIRLIVGIFIFGFLALSLLTSRQHHLKFYEMVVLAFNFMSKNRIFSSTSKKANTSLLMPYQKLDEDFIETTVIDGGIKYFIGAFEIRGFNISNLSFDEQHLKIALIQDFLQNMDCKISLMKIDQPINSEANLQFLKEKIKYIEKLYEENKLTAQARESRISQLEAYIDTYTSTESTVNSETTSKRFYLFVYHKKKQSLKNYLNLAESKILDTGLRSNLLNKYELINVIKLLFNPFEKAFKDTEIDEYQANISDLLTFDKVEFHKDYFKINDIYYCVSGVHDYPISPANGWGASLASCNASMIWNLAEIPRDEIKRLMDRAISNATVNMLSVKKILDKHESVYHLQAFQKLVQDLTNGQEKVKRCNILFLNYGKDLKSLRASKKELNQIFKDNNMTIDHLLFRQIDGFSAILPKPTDPLSLNFSREIPCWTVASSFPFMNNALEDEKGLFMGFNVTNDIVIFDQFKQNNHRKNFNQLIMGTSGSGKSHLAKKELNWHISNGRKVIVIDPEREYKNLCRYHDGIWIDVGNGSQGKINPLQVLSVLDDSETIETIIANHLQTLESWFSIILPDFDADTMRALIQSISQLYDDWGLQKHKDLGILLPEQFPRFIDLANILKNKQQISPNYKKVYDVIQSEFTGNGKYAQLYNFHSTLVLNKNLFTVFDINSLFEKGNNKIIQAQLFLILAYIQNEVKISGQKNDQEIIILIDEAHLIIDKENPVGLNFMFQMVKRIRKRHGGIILITQNPDDFVGTEDIRKKTTAMMNNTQYTTILNLSPQNLKDVAEIFRSYGGLSKNERDFIAKAKRGEGLFVISGFNRHCVQFELTKKEVEAFN